MIDHELRFRFACFFGSDRPEIGLPQVSNVSHHGLIFDRLRRIRRFLLNSRGGHLPQGSRVGHFGVRSVAKTTGRYDDFQAP